MRRSMFAVCALVGACWFSSKLTTSGLGTGGGGSQSAEPSKAAPMPVPVIAPPLADAAELTPPAQETC